MSFFFVAQVGCEVLWSACLYACLSVCQSIRSRISLLSDIHIRFQLISLPI